MNGPLAEGVADCGLVVVHAVRADFRRADHAAPQVLDKIVRGRAVPLAGAIGDDRPCRRRQPNVGVLVAECWRLMQGERELTTGLLSEDSSFRLIVSGQVGVKEIERLIKKLELDKEILADDPDADIRAELGDK
jgi:hypothetical protein